MSFKNTTAYLAIPGFEKELSEELGDVCDILGKLYFSPGPIKRAYFCRNVWFEPELIEFSSIKDAAIALKKRQKNWQLYSYHLHRRAALIQDNLPKLPKQVFVASDKLPSIPRGSWTLYDQNHLIASPDCSSNLLNGEMHFLEDKVNPPSRAYLKLWEAFSRFDVLPEPQETVIDLGSSPGGWTWVLSQIAKTVYSVDKASLDPRLMNKSNITFIKDSAFGFDPSKLEPIDWMFSDIICYPERLLKLVEKWQQNAWAKNFFCSIKFQGKTDFETLKKFEAIPNSQILHLTANKHELSWLCLNK